MQEILATLLIKHQLSTKCRWGSQLIASCVWQMWASHNSLHTGICLSFYMTSWWMDIPHFITLPLHAASILLLPQQTLMLRSVRQFLLWLKWYCLPWVPRCWGEILAFGTADDDFDDPDKECSSKLAWNIEAVISCYAKIYERGSGRQCSWPWKF